jgi:FkbM family methyltransferase
MGFSASESFLRDARKERRECGRMASTDIAAPAPGYGWGHFFSLLKRYGFAPRWVLDVGANRGLWTREAFAHFPEASFVLVEPQEALRACVVDLLAHTPKFQWIAAGVSDRPGTLPLTIAPDDTSSNFGMTPEAAAQYGYRQAMAEVRTIDDIVAGLGLPAPDMMKIDAEGFDLKALRGATSVLGKTDIVFVEAAVCATGIENTMAAVITAMTQYGYRMIDITDLNRSPKHGVLWLAELAFMRNGCALLEKISSYV